MIEKKYSLPFAGKHTAILSIILLIIIADIFYFLQSSDLIIFGVLGVYLITVWIFKLSSQVSFSFALFFLIIMYSLFLLSDNAANTEKAAVWMVLFLAIGVAQKIRE